MITEVSPAPKIYLFYALFQTVGVGICLSLPGKGLHQLTEVDASFPQNRKLRDSWVMHRGLPDRPAADGAAQIGPFIGSAIIDDANGNPEAVFYLILPMMLVGYALLWMVNPDKAKIDNAKCEMLPNQMV